MVNPIIIADDPEPDIEEPDIRRRSRQDLKNTHTTPLSHDDQRSAVVGAEKQSQAPSVTVGPAVAAAPTGVSLKDYFATGDTLHPHHPGHRHHHDRDANRRKQRESSHSQHSLSEKRRDDGLDDDDLVPPPAQGLKRDITASSLKALQKEHAAQERKDRDLEKNSGGAAAGDASEVDKNKFKFLTMCRVSLSDLGLLGMAISN